MIIACKPHGATLIGTTEFRNATSANPRNCSMCTRPFPPSGGGVWGRDYRLKWVARHLRTCSTCENNACTLVKGHWISLICISLKNFTCLHGILLYICLAFGNKICLVRVQAFTFPQFHVSNYSPDGLNPWRVNDYLYPPHISTVYLYYGCRYYYICICII